MPIPFRTSSLDEVDEKVRSLYKKSGDGYVLDVDGIEGAEEVQPLKSALERVRKEKDDLKKKVELFRGRSPEEVEELFDELQELKAGGKIDLSKLPESEREALVKDAVEAKTRRLMREKEDLVRQLDEEKKERETLKGQVIGSKMESFISEKLTGRVRPEAMEDALYIARAELVYDEESGSFHHKDGTAGEKYLQQLVDKKKHWQNPSKGSGASGGTGDTAGGTGPSSMLDLVKEACTK